jgi:SHS2 domain-containing protein
MSFIYPEGGPTADLLVEATGKTLGEAFANLALGMFNTITPIGQIAEEEEFELKAEGRDLESLLFNLMDEFLYIHDTEHLVPHTIKIEVDIENLLAVAKCVGEKFSSKTHEVGISVKAVTYHKMKILEMKKQWIVRMVFDT